ncbi:ubiquinone biosynthesis methyltransferase UbiE [Croceibacterium mercuriale]|uniref:Ubiquinone biosynthesis methyltransferase UbiE n=1 Tax=Croceibacterium mercuriale TaxID=1572751 RepID=A0A0B2C1U0_9SPHN|nr:class I SAM-dependent methyltransferase [Croceibacterium mercuriale]KHL25981.1 ubiquinone biosynthesis methyltransferase UbiE [Croceibacterium mercuriale]
MLRWSALCLSLALAACSPESGQEPVAEELAFPAADRPVSDLGATAFADETLRDSRQEAATVMQLAGVRSGMSVADIGAGEGYYTVRLAETVGPQGRVLAQDIDRGALLRLGDRVESERLDNVSIVGGKPDDPHLPVNSFDRIFLIHMYHEVGDPYAFLWHLHPALRPGGQIVVVDVDRSPDRHGIPPQLLFCELGQVGYRLVEFVRHPALAGYYAQFEAMAERPQPKDIRPCALTGSGSGTPDGAGGRTPAPQ